MKKKVFSLLLAGMLALSMGTTAYATEGEIADMQAQKQEAAAGLAQAQAVVFFVIIAIISLTQVYVTKKREVEM